MNQQGRILVIRGGAIGDFILTLPAIAALRNAFPAARLELLGYPHIASLAQAGGLVDCVKPIEARALAGFFAEGGMLSEELRRYFASFDVIVSYLYDPDGVFRRNVGRCSTAHFIQCPHRATDTDRVHATITYLKPLEQLAIFDPDPIPRLTIPKMEIDSLIQLGKVKGQPGLEWRNSVALHPGSGSERKNWPEHKWRDLITHLLEKTTTRLLIVGGEAEFDRLDRLTKGLPANRAASARSLPLVELAAILQNTKAFVGHDSGITHLASALGLPCVVIWADSNPDVWRPPAPNATIIHEKAGIHAVPVDRVWTALLQYLDNGVSN